MDRDINVNLFTQWEIHHDTTLNNFIDDIKQIGIVAIVVGSRLLCRLGHLLLGRGHGPPLLLWSWVGEILDLDTSLRVGLLSHLGPGRGVQLGLARRGGAGGGPEHGG